jgi:hypothetical protein
METDWTLKPQPIESTTSLVGFDVEAVDGHVGTVDQYTTDAGASHLVIKSGWWIFGRRHLVPASVISGTSSYAKKVFLTMTKHEVRRAPTFRPVQNLRRADEYNETNPLR